MTSFAEGRLFELYQMRADIEPRIRQLEEQLGRSPSNEGSGHSAEPEPCSTVSALRASVLNAALESIAEGNLGDAPWQANYDRIREVARSALTKARGEA